jgi:hypothetical protein
MGYQTFEGRAVAWSAAMVHKVLTSRALLGEYQPHAGKGKARKPAGPVVPDYYPRALAPEEFAAVQAALRTRLRVGRGRPGRTVNLFAGCSGTRGAAGASPRGSSPGGSRCWSRRAASTGAAGRGRASRCGRSSGRCSRSSSR